MVSSQYTRNSFKMVIMVLILTVPLTAVTVNSALCPTNKIAPHRRISKSFDLGHQSRTLGAFHDLLTPGPGSINQGYNPSLQEEPQRDDPDDCGDIDDYDEHDLSALTQKYQRGDEYHYGEDSKLFFGLFNRPQSSPNIPQQPQYSGNRPQQPQYPANRPQQPQYPANRPQQPQYTQSPQRPSRPPYASGGYFQNKPYRPPIQHYPSDDIKPVHDGVVDEPQTTYWPQMVGGQLNHVVGVSPVSVQYRPRPTRRPEYPTTRHPDYERYPTRRRRPDYETTSYDERYPQSTTQQPPYAYSTKRSRPRQLNNNNESILGSFFDLLF